VSEQLVLRFTGDAFVLRHGHETRTLAHGHDYKNAWYALGFGLRETLEYLKTNGKPPKSRMLVIEADCTKVLGQSACDDVISYMLGDPGPCDKDVAAIGLRKRCLAILVDIAGVSGYGWKFKRASDDKITHCSV